ncbi:MAG: hypothetical protein EHM21_00965 [Chloroflexi bacterium]|nr:MAG: hypothetical protein EHM21_00965 [Chloroflexota bacterium]
MESLNALLADLVAFLPTLLAAILVLVVGWIVALVISKLFERLLRRTNLDNRIAGAMRGGQPERIPAERSIALVIFWVIMIFVFLIFLQTLNLGEIATPINFLLTEVLAFLPNLLSAAILLIIAVALATVLRLVITRVLSASGISQRLSDNAQVEPRNRITIGQTIGNVVFWLVILLFLPAILGALRLEGILVPVQSMVNGILAALPNILGAIAVLAVGYLVARIIRGIVANLLTSVGVDRLGERTGVNDVMRENRLSDVIATIVFVLIMIPVAIAALNVLNIPAVSEPAANMLNSILNALPAIFGAFLILVIAYFAARLVAQLVSSILAGIGFNRVFSPSGPIPVTGLNTSDVEGPVGSYPTSEGSVPMTGATGTTGGASLRNTRPSDIVGWIVMIAILLFAVLQAAQVLGFAALTVLIGQFIVAAWNILFGLVIFGVGLWLATLVYRAVRNTGTTNAEILASAARIALIVFSAALALRQMGIAEEIVNLAFGLMLGAIAVAAAIAFGIGGRDEAKRLIEQWRGQLRERAARSTPIPQTGGTSQDMGMGGSNPTMGRSGTTDFDRTPGIAGEDRSGFIDTPGSGFDQDQGFNRNPGDFDPGRDRPGRIDDEEDRDL